MTAVVTVGLVLFIATTPFYYINKIYAVEPETPVTDGADVSDTVDVEELEIGDYKDVMSVDETQEIAVTVLPQNATEQTVTYESSDESVLTVDSKGTVKGISAGKATVTVSAGGMTKRVSIRVREATAYIEVDSDYLVLKSGEVHQIRARAMPGGASQDIAYKSLNPKVARVTKTGVVKAQAMGSASILVSNDEMSAGITVIVNEVSAAPRVGGVVGAKAEGSDGEDVVGEESGAEYAELLSLVNGLGRARVPVADYPTLTKKILSAIYAANADVELTGPDYSIGVAGGDIVNMENELATVVAFAERPDGVGFLLNRGRNLPGKVRLTVTDKELMKKYVYLYNDAKKKYELLDVRDGGSLTLDAGGEYLMTDEKISGFGIDPFIVGVAAAAVGAAIVVFIIAKRRYWFW
jgi:hypothetical protein